MTTIVIFCFPELPHFLAKPSSMTVEENENITLPCKAAGFPRPVITWYRNGHMIENRRQVRKGKLVLNEIQFEDRGLYTCTAENILGKVQLTVEVTVKGIYSVIFCAGYCYSRHVNKLWEIAPAFVPLY